MDCLRVGWSTLFESGLQQKAFQKFHFMLRKACYFQSHFFVLVIFLSCSEAFGINKRFFQKNIKFSAHTVF